MTQKNFFLFPGQGSQSVGMGKFLLEVDPVAQDTFAEADRALGSPLTELMFNGPEEKLKETENTQPAILTVSVAVGRILKKHGITPVVMAGHSLGEYSALVLAESISFSDAVRVVQLRGRFMQEAVPLGTGTMSAVLGAEDTLIEEVCAEVSAQGSIVEPANYNCPGQLVISGTNEGVAEAVRRLQEKGVKRCIPLSVSAPFHCSLLKPAAKRLEKELAKVKFSSPNVPYVANVDSSIVTDAASIAGKLKEQVYRPVRWTHSVRKAVESYRPDRALEVGPGQVVNGHLKKIVPDLPRGATDRLDILQSLWK
jgi:[acyl-carrier-protein] S-malonyltransferase